MRRLAFVCVFLLVSSSVATGGPGDRAAAFTIQLENVKESEAETDLLNLFIRENQNTLQINVTLKNRQVTVGRSRPTLYYLEDLRVRPGHTIRVKPDGRAPAFEAKIQRVEARFPEGKPPQLLIQAFAKPEERKPNAKPYRVTKEGFNGVRQLVEQGGKRKPDQISCFGETPGDLRIRWRSLIDAEGVGRGFSTTYIVDDIRHFYDPNNGLRSNYAATHYVSSER